MCFGKINSGMKMPTDNLRTIKTNDQNVNQIVSVVEESIKIMPDSLKVEPDNKRKEDIDYSRFRQPMNRPYYPEGVNPWPIINGPIRPIDGKPALPIDNPNDQETNDEKQPIDKKNDPEISVKHPWNRPYYPGEQPMNRPYYPDGINPRPIMTDPYYPNGINPRPIIPIRPIDGNPTLPIDKSTGQEMVYCSKPDTRTGIEIFYS
tara:strand:- start:51 stop:665 length:615 start_codon:yes stop_codon:yes gene_type:complete